MIMLFLMSYSLLCRSANDPPRRPHHLWTAPTSGWHISNLRGVGVALGEALVSQVFNKPHRGHRAGWSWRALTSPSPSLPWPLPHVLRPSPIILARSSSSSYPRQQIFVASSPLFRPHSSLLHLPRSACLCSALPAFLQHMPGLLGHQLHSEDFIWTSSSGRHYKDHHRASRLMLH